MEQDSSRRFSTLLPLYGEEGLARLRESHVIVAGIGGVGSWAAEALARSGVGAITLIDLDNVSESNINRQIHALTSTLGAPKVEVMAERIREINSECKVTLYEDFLTKDNLSQLLASEKESWIIDAIDQVSVKAALIAWAKRARRKIITTGAAGGKSDSAQLVIDDLNYTYHDPLCARLKSRLRREYSFPSKPKKFGIPVVFSQENQVINRGAREGRGLQCGGYGSVVTVTATMGFLASNYVINRIVKNH